LTMRVRDPQGHLLDERDRVGQRPHPQSRSGPRPLPQRDRGAEVRLHGIDESRPDRQGPQKVDCAVEGPLERIPSRLRRPRDLHQLTVGDNQDQPLTGRTR
jgi:hypothetical protein